MKEKLFSFVKKEPVLAVSALLAVVSMAAVPPSAAYLDYIDVRVLCLLFCLMAVVAGLQECGVFTVLAQRLLRGEKSFRAIQVMLVVLPLFSSMLVTNDVALITFVPFAILVLDLCERQDALIRVVVLQTMAANLGSMATPVGNPQNLFLYAHYDLSGQEFFSLMLPVTAVSFVALVLCACWNGNMRVKIRFPEKAKLRAPRKLMLYILLFALCLLSVFRVIHYGLLTAAVAAALALAEPKLLRRVDYGLLVTFVFFFVFSGNLGQMPAVYDLLTALLEKNVMLCSAAVSQIISNVPAAVLLSGLTQDWRSLMLGVDIGGLGTPVASLASLISLKYYLRTPGHDTAKYLLWFTAANVIGLAGLLLFESWI